MSAGLAVLAVSMFMFAGIDTEHDLQRLLIPFILMGIGIALVMSPMSTAAMNAVSVQKSGVASGVLQMSRMVGASVGVAATGAIFQSQLGSGFNPAALATAPEQARATFVDALSSAMLLAAIVVVAGLVVSLTLIRRARAKRVDTHEAAEEAVEAVPVVAAAEEAVHRRRAALGGSQPALGLAEDPKGRPARPDGQVEARQHLDRDEPRRWIVSRLESSSGDGSSGQG